MMHGMRPSRGACVGAVIQRAEDGLQRHSRYPFCSVGDDRTGNGGRVCRDRRNYRDQSSLCHDFDPKTACAVVNNRTAQRRDRLRENEDQNRKSDHRDHDHAAFLEVATLIQKVVRLRRSM